MFNDLKYILAYLGSIVAYVSISLAGYYSCGVAILFFIVLPILDFFATGTKDNVKEDHEDSHSNNKFFSILLYLNFPIVLFLLITFFNQISSGHLSGNEMMGITISMGLIIGANGINVAHELGHRSEKLDLFIAKFLLMIAFYMQFNIEHNRGHHKFVATREDPSSARFRETVFAFWLRSIYGVYTKAWKLENHRLNKLEIPILSWSNEMIRFHIYQLVYVFVIAFFWSWKVVLFAFVAGLIGVILLETVNYIEHYGLERKKRASGRYEPVGPHHSWNSNNEMGRIFLYELTRHSDHHYKATRKYQVLRHFDTSPQLPTGYPGCMLLALIPPLWFRIMDQRVLEFNQLEISY